MMRPVAVVAARELRSLFLQPLAWIVLTVMMLLNGWAFSRMLDLFGQYGETWVELVRFLLTSIVFWVPMLIGVPVIAMRLVAEERQTGTIETLLSAPVTETQVVLGKFAAAWAFLFVLWSPLLIYFGVIEYYGDLDWGAALAGFAGLLLIGGYFLAVALCVSICTRNQIVAALVGFVAIFMLFLLPLLSDLATQGTAWRSLFDHIDVYTALDEMSRGVVKTGRIVYPASGIVLFLFVGARVLESVKGR